MIPGDNDGEQIVTGHYTETHSTRKMIEHDVEWAAARFLVNQAPPRVQRRVNIAIGLVVAFVVVALAVLAIGDFIRYGGIPG